MKTLRLLPLFLLGLLAGVQAASAAPQAGSPRSSSASAATPGELASAVADKPAPAPAPANRPTPSARAALGAQESTREGRGATGPASAKDASTVPGYGEVEWIRTPRPQVPQGRTDGAAQDNALDGLRQEASTEWTVELTDRSFRQTLLRWTRIANWQLVWEVERDFAIDAQVTLNGNFLEALNQAMTSLRDTDYPVQARINPDTRVVRVVRYMLDGERR